MLKQEILEASRKEAEQAKKKLKNIEETPTGITGGGSAAGHTVTRTAMRKNNDNISKSVYIQHVLNQLSECAPNITGVIPHPIAWDIMEDDGTYYLHEIDGPDIECVYTKENGQIIFHLLTADGRTLIDQDTPVKITEKKDTVKVIIAVAAIVAALVALMMLSTIMY